MPPRNNPPFSPTLPFVKKIFNNYPYCQIRKSQPPSFLRKDVFTDIFSGFKKRPAANGLMEFNHKRSESLIFKWQCILPEWEWSNLLNKIIKCGSAGLKWYTFLNKYLCLVLHWKNKLHQRLPLRLIRIDFIGLRGHCQIL